MNLQQIYNSEGFNKIYKLLSNEVSIFEKRMETLLFIKFIGKGDFVILKKNKKPITKIDKILNPIYKQVEDHFSTVRYLKRFKNFIFKIGASEKGIRLQYVKDQNGDIHYQSEVLKEYAKLLKIKPLAYVYEGILNAKQKNHLIENHIEKKSILSGVIKVDGSQNFYNFGNYSRESIPKDINVIIVTDFIKFFKKNEFSVIFDTEDKSDRYIKLMTQYFIEYYKANSHKFANIHFDAPNYTINSELIENSQLLEIFEKDNDAILIYKVLLGSFAKKMHSRGLYNEIDINNINEVINKINLKIKGLDFINSIK